MLVAFVLTLCAKDWKFTDVAPLQGVATDAPALPGETGETAVKPAGEAEKPTEGAEKPTEEVNKPTEEAEKPAEASEKPTEASEKPAEASEKPAGEEKSSESG